MRIPPLFYVILAGLVAALAVASYTYLSPKSYTSKAQIFVIGSLQDFAPVRPERSMVPSLTSAMESVRVENYIKSILISTDMQVSIDQELHLRALPAFWGDDETGDASQKKRSNEGFFRRFAKITKVVNAQGLLEIKITTGSPDLSYKICERLISKLNTRTRHKQSSEEKFLAEQLELSGKALSKADDELRKFQEKSDLLIADADQGRTLFANLVEIRQQAVTARADLEDVQNRLNAPGTIEKKWDLLGTKVGLEGRLGELDAYQKASNSAIQKLPRLSASYRAKTRDIGVAESRYKILAEMVERARIANAGQGLPYDIISSPSVPDEAERKFIMVKTALGFLAGAGLALAAWLYRSTR